MAQVKGPLYSMSASGMIGKAMIFGTNKGRQVVRQFTKATNPQTSAQGIQRFILGGLGALCSPVQFGSYIHRNFLPLVPAHKTWVSFLVSDMYKNAIYDLATFEYYYSYYDGHALKSKFDDEAPALGLRDFDIEYKPASNSWTPGFQLFLLALIAQSCRNYDENLFNKEPYLTAFDDWDSDDVDLFIQDLSN